MTHQEEKYIHFVTCLDDLNRSWRILNEIKESPGNPLIGPAFELALIDYAKPYRSSRGALQNNKGNPLLYKLDAKHVPPAHLDLHHRLLRARDQTLAHSDLTVMEAKLYVARTSVAPHAFIVQNVIYGAAELPNIDMIIALIEETLQRMYAEAKTLEAQLTPNYETAGNDSE